MNAFGVGPAVGSSALSPSSMRIRRIVALIAVATLMLSSVNAPRAQGAAIARPEFTEVWQRTDLPVAMGRANRTWMWGVPISDLVFEPYQEGADGLRYVQYFDKARLELACPPLECADTVASGTLWQVTTGLLVTEMIDGRIQIGNNAFDETPESAAIGIVGDPSSAGGNGPTYADLGAWNLRDATPYVEGTSLIFRLGLDGTVTADPSLAVWNVVAANRVQVPSLDHTIASVFWEFMTARGLVYESGAFAEDELFENPFYATGYPVTEAYWTAVYVDGTMKDVLFQCFERRCLTFTPSNATGWQVESGNVGQHYYRWRYVSNFVTSEQHYETNVSQFLDRADSAIFDTTLLDTLPEHFDGYIQSHRWFAGAHLTNTALMFVLRGDQELADTYLSRSWAYAKDQNPSLTPPDQQSTAVFPILEYAFALRIAGDSFAGSNPAMVDEILAYIRGTANARASETPIGNPDVPDTDPNSIKINSYADTLAGYADLLMAAAALMPNDERAGLWVIKAREYAEATFSLGESIGSNPSVTTAYVVDGDIRIGNHCWPFHPSYQLTSVGLLGQGEFFAATAGIVPGVEFRHNTDWATRSVMHIVDSSDLYTIPETVDTQGKDDWLEDWKHQLWSTYINDTTLLVRKSSDMPADHNITVISTQCGVWSPAFQATVDSQFVNDTILMLKGVDIYRKVVQLLELQQRLGQPLHIRDRPIQLFSR